MSYVWYFFEIVEIDSLFWFVKLWLYKIVDREGFCFMIYGKFKNEFNRSRKKLRDGNRERERRREIENLNFIFF